jgi:hypothetical protein
MKKLTIFFIAVFLVFLGVSAAWAPCGIEGFVYCDVEKNGTFDPNEGDKPLPDVDILYDGAIVATTNSEGWYSISIHELCDGGVISLDVTDLPDGPVFINPSTNVAPSVPVLRGYAQQDWAIYSETCVPDKGEGCTPGYWKIKSNDKNHCWCDTYYDNPLLTEVYDPAALALYDETKKKNSDGFTKETLDDALDFKGGGDLEGAARKLLRQGTAALLNACTLNGGGRYPESESQIISNINEALLKQDIPTIDNLKNRYGNWNESESEDTCIMGTCMKTGESCIDEPCKTYHNCPIDSHCNTKTTLPEWILFIPFDVFMASENPVSCGGN